MTLAEHVGLSRPWQGSSCEPFIDDAESLCQPSQGGAGSD